MKYIALTVLLLAFAVFVEAKEDRFRVRSIEGGLATVAGDGQGLKAGDYLYSPRSPFKFAIKSVKGDEITLSLPPSHGLTEGTELLRRADETIRRNMETEAKLKRAIED